MSYHASQSPVSNSNSLAVVSLVFGILAWCVLPIVGAIVAIVCGHLARGEIRRAPPDAPLEGDGMALAGLVLGYVQLVFAVLAMLLVFGLFFLGFHTGWH
jgi:thiol:disulfide interchange protein